MRKAVSFRKRLSGLEPHLIGLALAAFVVKSLNDMKAGKSQTPRHATHNLLSLSVRFVSVRNSSADSRGGPVFKIRVAHVTSGCPGKRKTQSQGPPSSKRRRRLSHPWLQNPPE